jgi:hypothetical protein
MQRWTRALLGLLMCIALVSEALALEVSWRGRVRFRSDFGRFSGGAGSIDGINPRDTERPNFVRFGFVQTDQAAPLQKEGSEFIIRQRARIWTTLKANEHLSASWGVEIGYLDFGNPFGTAEGGDGPAPSGQRITSLPATLGRQARIGRSSGGGLATDGVNIETKNLYMEVDWPTFHPAFKARTTLGSFTWWEKFTFRDFDAFKLWAEDVPGIMTAGKIGPADFELTWVRAGANPSLADLSRDNNWWVVSTSYPLPFLKDTRIGAGFWWEDYNDAPDFLNETFQGRFPPAADPNVIAVQGRSAIKNIHAEGYTYGLNFETRQELLGRPLTLRAYGLYRLYHETDNRGLTGTRLGGGPAAPGQLKREGFATNARLTYPLGPGTIKLMGFWSQGDDTREFGDRGARRVQRLHSFPNIIGDADLIGDHGLGLLWGFAVGDDQILVGSPVNNDDLGLISVQFAYLWNPVKEWSLQFNVVPVWSSADNPNSQTFSNFLGTEISILSVYRLWDQLRLIVQPGYFFTGDFFRTTGECRSPEGRTLLTEAQALPRSSAVTSLCSSMGGRLLAKPNLNPRDIWLLKFQADYLF